MKEVIVGILLGYLAATKIVLENKRILKGSFLITRLPLYPGLDC